MLSTLAINWVTLSLSTLLMFSMSLDTRLISSPWARWSKKAQRQGLQMDEEIVAEIAHRLLGRSGHDLGLKVGQSDAAT